jgi:hypothetical protein
MQSADVDYQHPGADLDEQLRNETRARQHHAGPVGRNNAIGRRLRELKPEPELELELKLHELENEPN